MKTKQMLSIKNITMLFVCVLFALANTQTVTAQEKAKAKAEVKYTTEQAVTVGDTVMINKDSLRYLTGERKSTWVYKKKHTVGQVGTKRFPNGVLLKEIRSWVAPSSLIPVAIAAPPVVKEEPVVEEVVEEVVAVEPVKEDTDSLKKAVESAETEQVVTYDIPISLQMDRFSIGLRGGMASTMVEGFPIGFDVLLDLQYAHYWAAHSEAVNLGILTGVSAGYVNVHQKDVYSDQFQSGDINYLVTSVEVDEQLHQVLLEVPVMFSMITPGGFFLNVGPKLMLPVYSPLRQTLEYPNISAYLPELNGEVIKNEVVTGVLTPEQCDLKGRADNEFKLAIALGLELGYEFALNNGHSIGLGAYASCTAYSMYKNTTDGKIISVVAPNETSVAVVTVNPMTNALSEHIGHLDAGIKLSYNFNFKKD